MIFLSQSKCDRYSDNSERVVYDKVEVGGSPNLFKLN